MVLMNLALLGIGLVAVDWWRKPSGPIPTRREGTIIDGFLEPAADLGYIGRADHRVTARLVTENGQTIYDVVYTIGSDHFRITPQAVAQHTACVSVFGDSFAFGTGLNDDQTFAWRLVDESGGRTGAQIFAFPGWGPQQLLGGLQSGRFRAALRCTPTVAIYTLISVHMSRLTGRFPWARGPRFRLSDGQLERVGDLPPDPAPGPVDLGWLGWRRLIGERGIGTSADVDLTVAIFREALAHLQDLPGQPPLHVLYFDSHDNVRTRDLLNRLAALGIVVHRVEAFLPDFAARRSDYVLGAADHHPNAHANQLIADYIARRIMSSR